MNEIDITPLQEDNLPYFVKHLPIQLQEAYKRIPSSLLECTETTLRTAYRPGATYETIRVFFWDLIERAVRENRQIQERELYTSIMTQAHYKNMCANVQLLAFILVPRVPYDVKVQQLLDRSLEKVEEILSINIRGDNGEIDPKRANLVMAAFKMLDMRKHGGYIQRIEEKSMTLHGSVKDAQAASHVEKKSMAELDARIKQLEAEIKEPPKSLDEPQDVEYVESES